jgi:hypothetical protein
MNGCSDLHNAISALQQLPQGTIALIIPPRGSSITRQIEIHNGNLVVVGALYDIPQLQAIIAACGVRPAAVPAEQTSHDSAEGRPSSKYPAHIRNLSGINVVR